MAENRRSITGDAAGMAPLDQPVLVTGGAGFIGSHFVRHLMNTADCAVLNLDLLTYAGNLDSLADLQNNPRHQLVQGDIGNLDLVDDLLRHHQPQAVINLAAESHVDRSIDTPDDFIQTNVVATGNLLKACLSYWETLPVEAQDRFRFLHVSTDEVYGSLGVTGMFTEQTRYAPNSPYAASKAASDHLVRAYHHTYGLPTMVSNSSNNYGPAQFPEKLIPLMILNAQEGLRLPVYGDGTHVRDWLYVTDHCEALWTILQSALPGETYNIGANSEKTNLEIVETICDAVDDLLPGLAHAPSRSLIDFVTDRPGHDRRYAIDATKLKSELGWHARTSFAEGIRRTVAWYLENSAWVAEAMTKGYQRQRLGLPTAASETGTRASSPTKAAPEYVVGEQIEGVVVRDIQRFIDDRGWLVELVRNDELAMENRPAMAYLSETMPGVTRGPHEHVHQTDCFAFVGPGEFQVYLWDSRPLSKTYGVKMMVQCGAARPACVVVPPGVVHAYKNTSDVSGSVFNAPDQLYGGPGKSGPVDEIRHEECAGSPYQLE